MIDAPVSGGTGGAIAGTLTFMVGGSEEDLERARPLLEKMGANIFHAGGAGAGQTAKICNNMLLGVLMIGTSEAIALGVANGLDPKVLSEIMRRSSGGNWALEKYNPLPGVMENAPASKGYAGGFGTDLMLKDLGLAQENAMAVGAATPLGGLARNLYAAHSLRRTWPARFLKHHPDWCSTRPERTNERKEQNGWATTDSTSKSAAMWRCHVQQPACPHLDARQPRGVDPACG